MTEPEPSLAAPWEQGYSLARKLRAHLGLNGAPLNSIERIGDVLGATEADLNKILSSFSSGGMPFAALMGINDSSSPAFVLRPALLPTSRLFHFCRALFEYLFSSIRRTALNTDASTEQQKRNRACAAELLALQPPSARGSRRLSLLGSRRESWPRNSGSPRTSLSTNWSITASRPWKRHTDSWLGLSAHFVEPRHA
jgi:hypothetical protein